MAQRQPKFKNTAAAQAPRLHTRRGYSGLILILSSLLSVTVSITSCVSSFLVAHHLYPSSYLLTTLCFSIFLLLDSLLFRVTLSRRSLPSTSDGSSRAGALPSSSSVSRTHARSILTSASYYFQQHAEAASLLGVDALASLK